MYYTSKKYRHLLWNFRRSPSAQPGTSSVALRFDTHTGWFSTCTGNNLKILLRRDENYSGLHFQWKGYHSWTIETGNSRLVTSSSSVICSELLLTRTRHMLGLSTRFILLFWHDGVDNGTDPLENCRLPVFRYGWAGNPDNFCTVYGRSTSDDPQNWLMYVRASHRYKHGRRTRHVVLNSIVRWR